MPQVGSIFFVNSLLEIFFMKLRMSNLCYFRQRHYELRAGEDSRA